MIIGFVKNTITSLIISIFLSYILITTEYLLTKIIVIPFLICSISLFIKNIFLIFKKDKIAKIFSILNEVSFYIYYFGFLIYWDYVAITNKDYISLIFSLSIWVGGIFVAYKRYLIMKNK